MSAPHEGRPPGPTRPLPPRPSLEHLRKQAKRLLRDELPPGAKLADAQHEVARRHGLASWPRLKRHVEALNFARDRGLRLLEVDEQYYVDRAHGFLSVLGTGQRRAIDLAVAYLPRLAGAADPSPEDLQLSADEARLVLAREHGHESWGAFAEHLAAIRAGAPEPFLDAVRAIKGREPAKLECLLSERPELARLQGANGNSLLNIAAASFLDPAIGRHPTVDEARSSPAMRCVDLLLLAGADIDLPNNKGGTALHQAAYSNNVALVERLLAGGASPFLEAHGEGGTPLLFALFWGHVDAAGRLAREAVAPMNLRVAAGLGRVELLEACFDGEALRPEAMASREFHRPHSGFPPWRPSDDPQEALDEALTYAARCGRLVACEFLVARGANPNAEPYNGTAVFHAAAKASPEVLRSLLAHGGDVHHRAGYGGERGITALHVAVWGNRAGNCRVLLDAGADPLARDPRYDATPLGWSHHCGGPEARAFLLGLDRMDVTDAAQFGKLERVRAWLDSPEGHPDGRARDGVLLRNAAAGGHAAVVGLLLGRGADRTLANNEGKTALDWALAHGHDDVARLLRNA